VDKCRCHPGTVEKFGLERAEFSQNPGSLRSRRSIKDAMPSD